MKTVIGLLALVIVFALSPRPNSSGVNFSNIEPLPPMAEELAALAAEAGMGMRR